MVRISTEAAFIVGTVVLACAAYAGGQQSEKSTEVGISIKRTKKMRSAAPPAAIKVTIDGKSVAFADQGPRMLGGRVVVPLRGVFERMGAHVQWDQEQNMVVATQGENRIELPMGKTTAVVAGKMVELDQPATVVAGRAMVPLRFVSESLGAKVEWLAAQNLVTIRTRGIGQGSLKSKV
jgi:hypothetical protein